MALRAWRPAGSPRAGAALRSFGMAVARPRVFFGALLLVFAAVAPADAGLKISRVVYTLGPVTGDAERVIGILRARLGVTWLLPVFTREGDTIKVELFQPKSEAYVTAILTRQGVFSIHGGLGPRTTCEGFAEPGRLCLPTPPPNGRFMAMDAEPALAGDVIEAVEAQPGIDGAPALLFRFTPEASKTFAAFTTASVGRKIAIVIDGAVVTAPIVHTPILGGAGVLIGSDLDVQIWVAVLSHPPLPAPLGLLGVEAVSESE